MVRYAPLAALAVAPQLAFGACVKKSSTAQLASSSTTLQVASSASVAVAAATSKATTAKAQTTSTATQAKTSATSVKASTSSAAAAAASSSSSSTVAAPSASSSSSSSSGTVSVSSSSAVSGTSTFYGGNLSGGTCSFTTMSELPSGIYGTAFSGVDWDASACGACLQVTGPNGNSIKVMVVDECPECETGHLDLFQDAFAELGDISAGEIATSYVPVSCGFDDALTLHDKSGTSAYWFSMQVVGHNYPISALEVSTDGGSSWQSTTRQSYNYFENSSGFGTSTVSVRVTSSNGDSLVVDDVSVASESQVTASGNV